MKALIVGTGYSLKEQLHLIPRFDGLVFVCNDTYKHLRCDVWLACDPSWHRLHGRVCGYFDKWHWDREICEEHGYRYVEGVWMVDGEAYPRSEYLTPPSPAGGLWMHDKSRISLNHCSAAQLLNLACNQYEADEVVLVGHDFHYDAPQRHYFDDLSETAGEYPQVIRKHSLFDKGGKGDDLLQVYRRIAEQDGLPPIVNATPNSKLPWFPMVDFEEYTI